MIYSEQINKAMNLAYEAHAGQFDKAGVPYIYHCMLVAYSLSEYTYYVFEDDIIIALLHDVLEDNKNYTIGNIKELGFSENVIEGLKLLNHDKNESYEEYIEHIIKNRSASLVKLSDLSHNLMETRIQDIKLRNKWIKSKRYQQYKDAYTRLSRVFYE